MDWEGAVPTPPSTQRCPDGLIRCSEEEGRKYGDFSSPAKNKSRTGPAKNTSRTGPAKNRLAGILLPTVIRIFPPWAPAQPLPFEAGDLPPTGERPPQRSADLRDKARERGGI